MTNVIYFSATLRLLHGEADRNAPVAAARQVAAALPACRASFYPGEGHIPVLGKHLDEVLLTLALKATNTTTWHRLSFNHVE